MKKLFKKVMICTMVMGMALTSLVSAAGTAKAVTPDYGYEAQAESRSQETGGQVTVDTTGAGSVYHTVTYQWTSLRGGHTFTLSLQLDYSLTCAYRQIPRTHTIDFYKNYIYDEYNSVLVKTIADYFRVIQAQHGYSERQIIDEMIHFVQSNIQYQRDIEGVGVANFEKYPIETLYEGRGDCEDTAILLASLLRQFGYGSALIFYDNHAAVGLACAEGTPGVYYNMNGTRYYYIETTAMGWMLGMMPDSYRTKSAQILQL